MQDANFTLAKNVYDMIVSTLESHDFKLQKNDDELKVAFQIETDSLPIVFSVVTDAQRQLIRIIAGYSIVFPQEKRLDGAIATCMTNCNLVAGGFDYDYETGMVVYRVSSSFSGSVISPDALMYLIQTAHSVCFAYDDDLDKLAKGKTTLDSYLYMFDED